MLDNFSVSFLIEISNVIGVMIVTTWLMSLAVQSKPCRKCDLKKILRKRRKKNGKNE
jgi:hypothetical protein